MVPNSFFQQFTVYGANGSIDMRKSIKAYEEAFSAWIKEQSDLKPAILQEIQNYKRVGEGRLVNFTLHALRLMPTKENVERIQAALQELNRSGKIVYKETESGKRRGRGAGWSLATKAA